MKNLNVFIIIDTYEQQKQRLSWAVQMKISISSFSFEDFIFFGVEQAISRSNLKKKI